MNLNGKQELHGLVSDYFLRDLSKGELNRLQEAVQSDEEIMQAFADASRDEWLMHHVHHMNAGRIVHFEPRKKGLRRMRAMAAGVALLISLGVLYLARNASFTRQVASKPTASVLARVSECYILEGELISVVNNGRLRKISDRSNLYNGDRVVVPAGCRLSFQYLEEETTVQLGNGSHFEINESDRGKHIRLNKGRLQADVARQPEGQPMRIATPNAEAVVIGTSFEILTDGITRLSVTSGQVLFNAANAEQGVMVKSGFLAESADFMETKAFRIARFQPVEDRTLNFYKAPEFIAVDPVRNYFGFMKFDLKKINGRIIEAKLRLRVMNMQKDFGGSGKVRLFRVHPDKAGEGKRIQVAQYNGKVGGGMDLEFDIEPSKLSNGVNALLIALDENGNDFWFSSSRGEVAPQLVLKVVEEE